MNIKWIELRLASNKNFFLKDTFFFFDKEICKWIYKDE